MIKDPQHRCFSITLSLRLPAMLQLCVLTVPLHTNVHLFDFCLFPDIHSTYFHSFYFSGCLLAFTYTKVLKPVSSPLLFATVQGQSRTSPRLGELRPSAVIWPWQEAPEEEPLLSRHLIVKAVTGAGGREKGQEQIHKT